MTCIQCGYTIPNRLSTCPNCGRPAEAVPGAPGVPGNYPAPPRSGGHPFKLDASRWTQNDRIVAGASAVLLISLFLPWFGLSFLGATVTFDALASHAYLNLVLIVCIALLGYLVLRTSSLRLLPRPSTHDRLLLGATAVNFVAVLIGFLSTPGSSTFVGPLLSREYGAFVGGAAALVAVIPLAAAFFNVYG